MKRLIVVRHGETVDNAARRIQGQVQGKLSERGQQQVILLGERLRGEKIDRIFSSDLKRAKDTALAIAAHHAVPLEFVPELRERSWGAMEGIDVDVYFKMLEGLSIPAHEFRPEGGENVVDVYNRVHPFVSALHQRCPGETVLLTAHFTTNRAILAAVLSYDFEHARKLDQHNACINVVDFTGQGTATLSLLNDFAHLSSLR